MADEGDLFRMKELKEQLQKHLDMVIDMSGFTEKMTPKEAYVSGYQKAHENLRLWIVEYEIIIRDIGWFIRIKEAMMREENLIHRSDCGDYDD